MKFLIIDDEVDILEIIADQIAILGFDLEVMTASTVQEAQTKVGSCDAIISDINLPDRELNEAMLASCNKPVARITGHDDIKGELVIRKPFEVADFSAVIQRLIQLASNRKAA